MRPEHHEPTPDDRFRAYLREAEATGRMERPRMSRRERWAENGRFALAVGLVLVVSVLLAWMRG